MINLAKPIGRLHVITDTTIQNRFSHTQLAELAISGGADTIQFRQKNTPTRQLIETAKQLRSICRSEDVPLLINDRADIAISVSADGAHFGQDDLPIHFARKILPNQSIIGASARSEDKILQAVSEGADYIGFGPIFATHSKSDAELPKGLKSLERVTKLVDCPIIAIGGITLSRISEVLMAGAYGVAVISAVCQSSAPKQATIELMAEIEKGIGK